MACHLGPTLTSCFPLLLALHRPPFGVPASPASLPLRRSSVGACGQLSPAPHVQALIKQDNLDAFNERDPYKADDSREEEEENDDDNSLEGETFPLERDEVMPPPLQHPQTDRLTCPKGLPWAPKVR